METNDKLINFKNLSDYNDLIKSYINTQIDTEISENEEVYIGSDNPTKDSNVLWVDMDSSSVSIPEINDSATNTYDTWSSNKIQILLNSKLNTTDISNWAKSSTKPTYTASEVGALADTTTHLSGDIATTEKGVANGVATLNDEGKVPASQLPSYVDDVIEYASKSAFPTTGESGKIYIDTSDEKTYRWSGTTYVEISPSIVIGTTTGTALDGKVGKDHIDNTTVHITSAERTAWDGKMDSVNPVGSGSFSFGRKTGTDVGENSVAIGYEVEASGKYSYAEGYGTVASGEGSHAEGWETTSSGDCSHAEGCSTTASGEYSHAEGCITRSTGNLSHAEGCITIASGDYSHAEGSNTIASGDYSHVQGHYNIEDTENKYAHIVGNGTDYKNRSNAHTLDWNGNSWYAGNVTATKIIGDGSELTNVDASTIGGLTVKTAVPENAKFTDTTYSVVTTSANGLMSSTDKTKLDGIADNANNYTHPTYTEKSSGLYKITVDNTGHISDATTVSKSDITALGIPEQDTTYSVATLTTDGLMSSTDKTELSNNTTNINELYTIKLDDSLVQVKARYTLLDVTDRT